MSLLGSAALAMWWDMSADMLREFEDWHTHEHFRERLGIPGFLRATRWRSADGGEGIFQMYELDGHETLSSAAYLAHLNAPTPWSTKMMPHHRHMIRSQCRVLASAGGSVAQHALTLRLSPVPGGGEALQAALQPLVTSLKDRPGCVGAHLLRHEAPLIAATTEQKIRGGDRYADWVLVAIGYDADVLRTLAAGELAAASLVTAGAQPGVEGHLYSLSHSAVPAERM